MITFENGTYRYFDRNGTELHEGDIVLWTAWYKLYRAEDGKLGIKIDEDRGIYTLCESDTDNLVLEFSVSNAVRQKQENEIINRLNDILQELDDIGETIIDCVVDQRADDGLPPFTPEEYAEADAECDRNIELEQALQDERYNLMLEYFSICDRFPRKIGPFYY